MKPQKIGTYQISNKPWNPWKEKHQKVEIEIFWNLLQTLVWSNTKLSSTRSSCPLASTSPSNKAWCNMIYPGHRWWMWMWHDTESQSGCAASLWEARAVAHTPHFTGSFLLSLSENLSIFCGLRPICFWRPNSENSCRWLQALQFPNGQPINGSAHSDGFDPCWLPWLWSQAGHLQQPLSRCQRIHKWSRILR